MNRKIFLLTGGIVIVVLAALIGFIALKPKLENLFSIRKNTISENKVAQPDPIDPEPQKNDPQLFITGDKGYYGSGIISQITSAEPAITIQGYNVTAPVTVSIYKANISAVLEYLMHDAEDRLLNDKVDSSKFQLIATSTEDLTAAEYSAQSRVVLPIVESGVYFVHAESGDAKHNVFVVRSKMGVIAREGDNELIFWGQDTKTGKSITEGNIKVYNLENRRSEVARLDFDDEGIAKLPVGKAGDVGVIEYQGEYALLPINLRYVSWGPGYDSFTPKSLRSRNFIFTDRPLYRPGDTIYFKSILRDDNDAQYTLSEGSALVKMYKNYDEKQVVYEKNIPIVNGAISGQFVLPADASVGYYNLKVTTNASKNKIVDGWWFDSYYDTTSFQVEFFRKPEYTIDVTTPKTEYIAGDQIPFTLEGTYFSGQPISGQKIKYAVYANNFFEYDYFFDQNYVPDDSYRYGYWGGSTVLEGEVVLNEKGQAEILINATFPSDKGKNQVFSIEAQFDDGSGNPAFARKNVIVYPGEFSMYRKDTNYGSVVGTQISMPLILTHHQEVAVSSVANIGLTAKIRREDWVAEVKPNEKYPSYTKVEESLPEIKIVTNNAGEATLNFVPEKTGSFIIQIEATDKRGNKVIKEFYAWVVGKDQPFYGAENEINLVVKADKTKYAPTDIAKLTISSAVPNRDVFLSFERNGVHRYQIVHLKGNLGYLEVPLEAADMPNIFVKALSFSNTLIDIQETDIKIAKESKKLVVRVTPERKTVGPGDTVKVNIETTDVGGNPIPGDVTVWAVDKAIFELADQQTGDIFERFWSDRGNSTDGVTSLDGIGSGGGAEGGGCFAGDTPVLMSDGSTKSIESIQVGDQVLTREGVHRANLVSAKVVGIEKTEVAGYLILNGSLKVTPIHRLWVRDTWKAAGDIQIGDVMTDSNNHEVVIHSIEWQAGKFTVYNLEIEKYHTYFAGNVWVHNEKSGGSPRTVFKDTAYWNPSVRTDASGRAQVTFKIPDNLTTWVVAAVGATTDTKVGQAKEEIVVTKDVIIRPILPNILREGDEIILSALVQNFTDSDHVFDTQLQFNSGSVEALQSSSVMIPSKDIKQLYWKIRPTAGSEIGKLNFSAQTKDITKVGDTIEQTLPIRPFGFYETRGEVGTDSKTYTLKLSADSKLDKTSVTLSLAPTLLGTLPTAMEYLVEYPYGCVEQTTSRFVPAVIAKENQEIFGASIADKNIDEIIKTGIKRLEILQQQDGGWSWWYTGSSDPFITAYVVEYLVKAQNLGFSVPLSVSDRARAFLEQAIYTDTFNNKSASYVRDETIAKTYALTILGTARTRDTIFLRDFKDITPDVLALAVLSNVWNGDKNPETNGLTRLISFGKTEGEGMYWDAGIKGYFGSRDASTALAMRAIIAAGGDKAVVTKAARYLTRSRIHEYWSNTFATAQVIQGLVDFSKVDQELNPNYTYSVTLDGKEISAGKITNAKTQVKDIVIPVSALKAEGSVLAVTKSGDGELYSTVRTREFHTDKNAQAVNHGLIVERKYVSERGGKSIEVGDTVQVEITLSGLTSNENYGIIDDELPSGLIPINTQFKNEQYGQDYQWYYENGDREIKENGMLISLYGVYSGSKTYSYKARAVSAGTYTTPPTFAALMYAPEIYGRGAIDAVTIVEKGKGQILKDEIKNTKPVAENNQGQIKNIAGTPNDTQSLHQRIVIAAEVLVIVTLLTVLYFKKRTKQTEETQSEVENNDSSEPSEPKSE